MIQQRLLEEVERVAGRYRRLYRWSAISVVWLAAALVGTGLLGFGWRTGWTSTWTAPTLALVALVPTCFAVWLGGRLTRDSHWAARRIETRHPELATLLLAAIEQRADRPGGRLGFLQETVIRSALAHNRDTTWEEDVPAERIRAVQVAGLGALAALIVVTIGLARHAELSRAVAGLPPDFDVSARAVRYAVTVTPGDTEIERGTSLVVTARFAGNVPDNATLVYWHSSGETARVPMSLSLSDPVFGARVAGVQADLSYKVEYARRSSREYRVSVFEFPQLQRADAELVFPEYTSLEKKRIEDTRRITSVEGTELTLFCDLNKPVQTARLVDKEGKSIELIARGGDPTVYSATQVLESSMRCRLELVDAEGRRNKQPPEFVFNVTPNRRPDVKIALPGRDMRVSPIEELDTKASLWDDFGLLAYGVSYTLPGNPPQETALGEPAPGNQRKTVEHRIAFEDLEAEPDQLLAYYFWAEDAGPDGKPRRTMGDMYFAEVRHFEEIFRQGEQPPGGQSQQQQQQQGGQNARQAEELAEQQKQIINATWTVIRRETGAKPTGQFAGDVDELKTAQTQALEKLRELAENLQDAQSREFAAAVEQHMTEAITHLTEAGQPSPAALQPALSAEQAAYQALLKLRAREHRVIRGRQPSQQGQSGSASGPQSRAQRQLDQLELRDSENLYETQRQASSPQEQSQRENLQVLNRLRELARRQADLNKRLKELQSALEEAKTEQQREEIRRQLKRLREQQQQMVRDVDELAERMERPENQERMSQARQDLEQTRENIRQTTEALRQGQVSRAVASGTRAERQLEQMREEFRKAAANRFSDEARQLREDARELHQNETDLAERLRALDREKPATKTLRDSDDREQIREEFREQREDLEELLEKIRRTVEEAEEAEPLMAGQLYDSFRKARQQHVDDALDVTGELLERGLVDQARLAESQAARGIEELKQGVETAAESVLGDEDEALRRAHETLGELARQLNEEMRRATGQPAEPGDEQARNAGGQADRQPTEGEQPQDGRPQDQQAAKQPPDGRAADPSGRTGPRDSNRQPDEEPADAQQTEQAQQPGQSQDEPDDQRGRGTGEPRAQDSEQSSRRDGAPSQRQQLDGEQAQTPTGLERFRRPDGPITGDFVRWSDQLRDVEEMIDDPQMRGDVARIRDAARGIRYQMRRDFKGPNWDMVREFVTEPLNELRDRLAEEMLRRQPDETLVPIDRDPVPPEYADQVRRYYEQLGRGQ